MSTRFWLAAALTAALVIGAPGCGDLNSPRYADEKRAVRIEQPPAWNPPPADPVGAAVPDYTRGTYG